TKLCSKDEDVSRYHLCFHLIGGHFHRLCLLGIFINPVIPPACSPEDTLIRFSLMATHTVEQIDIAVEKLLKCFKELDIIK
ncbi:MAG: hypothetical protein PHY71_08795, partial [Bacteroidaceae bacterium]|nr:hypothetical protein [Bacteroidaceae bacterium]